MLKMACLFVREFHGGDSFTLTTTLTSGCEWVLAGEGTASRKRDGTACVVKGGRLWKRHDTKPDRKSPAYRAPPEGAIPCGEPDPVTGHWPHWSPLAPHDYWHAEAFSRQASELVDGETYELCGPKVQGNPEGLDVHTLIRHGSEPIAILNEARGRSARDFAALRDLLAREPIEGIVFAHPDGRHAKIRRRDFGYVWPIPSGSTSQSR